MSIDGADNPQLEYSVTDFSDLTYSQKADNARTLLLAASRRLESIEDLLLDPLPQHIEEAERLLQLDFRSDALVFQATSRRVLALLNGALRVHWHRLRRMGSYHETYTAAGVKKVCVPCFPHLDLKM
jgi:hypothetical protein